MKETDIISSVKKSYKADSQFNEKACKDLVITEKLPLYSYLIGKIMGDGHLSYNYCLHFISSSKVDLDELLELIIKVFSVSRTKMAIIKKKAFGTTYSLRVNYAIFGRILYSLGAPKGNKTKQSFFIPDWILSNQFYKRMFLMGLLEDELSTIKIAKMSHSIEPKLKMSKQEHLIENLRLFMQQVKNCIEGFGVQCSEVSKQPKSKASQNTKDLYFHILRNKRNIIQFEDEIGFFLNKDKKNKLEKCCLILRETLKPDIDREKIISLRKEGLSLRQIARIVPQGKTTIHRIITEQQDLNKN